MSERPLAAAVAIRRAMRALPATRGLLIVLLLAQARRVDAQPPERGPAERGPVHRVARAWPVMGTMFVATVWTADTSAALKGMRAARDSVRLVDSLMSTYRPASELSRVNALAGVGDASVSPQTLHVLLLARRYWTLSRGVFDPTVGPLVRAWDFDGGATPEDARSRVPGQAHLDSLIRLVGFGRVEIDSARSRVRLPEKGMSIDLGGIAKGYALDLARAALDDPRIQGGTLDLGGNVLAFGRPPAGRHWVIGVAHPRRPGAILGTVAIDSGAVATSGDYEHYRMIDGVRYGHLIDPATGYPRRGVLAATAVGPRGEMSDGLSATYFLLGPRDGTALADSLPGSAAIWVLDRGGSRVGSADVVVSRRARSIFTRSR